jgi:hypothetical protein
MFILRQPVSASTSLQQNSTDFFCNKIKQTSNFIFSNFHGYFFVHILKNRNSVKDYLDFALV